MIPAFNAEDSISRSVRSAVDAGAFEVIVVDDGSIDSTAECAERAGAIVIRQNNSGAAAARRAGVRLARGEYLILLDADDALVEVGVQRGLSMIAANERIVGAVGRVLEVGASGDVAESVGWSEGVTINSLYARAHSPAPPAAFVWRATAVREALEEPPLGLWPRYAEDYELVLRLALLGQIASHEGICCVYARDGGKSAMHPERSIASAQLIREHYGPVVGISVKRLRPAKKASLSLRKRSSAGTGYFARLRRVSYLAAAAALDFSYAGAAFRGGLSAIAGALGLSRRSAQNAANGCSELLSQKPQRSDHHD